MLIIKSKISFLRNLSWDTPADGDLVFVGLDVKVEGGEGGRGGEGRDSLGQEHVILGITTQALELRLFSQSPQNRWFYRLRHLKSHLICAAPLALHHPRT